MFRGNPFPSGKLEMRMSLLRTLAQAGQRLAVAPAEPGGAWEEGRLCAAEVSRHSGACYNNEGLRHPGQSLGLPTLRSP